MAKITTDKLLDKLATRQITEEEIATYFVVDETRSRAFAPRLKINPATVQAPRGATAAHRSAQLLNGANHIARMLRRAKYHRKLADGYDGPIIVSEGDSWFQYPFLLKDVIDHVMDDYAVYSVGEAGDLLKRMADQAEYMEALEETGAEIFLLSGGGNDLTAGGALASHLVDFDPDLAPADYLLPSFHRLLDDAIEHYSRICRQVHRRYPNVTIICHGYDHPVPNNDRWLGKPMQSRGINSRSLQVAIAAEMIDLFNRRLRQMARRMPHVRYIDCRGAVGGDGWHDGLHPTNEAFGAVAEIFCREISEIANTRRAPPTIVGGPFGSVGELHRTLAVPTIVSGGAPCGLSLHAGLNYVDPNHYAGWNGALKACENDAFAMQMLAENEGFTPTLLLTKDATRANVLAEIDRAAAELKAGDMFLFTISGHGGQIPDFNGDEYLLTNDLKDETLCLYDFQVADDELFMMWSKFAEGVRILVVPDTCHSGSMVRAGGPPAPSELFGRRIETQSSYRSMPRQVADAVARIHRDAYAAAADSYSEFKESVMSAPLSAPVRASVLNLGACQDHQFAYDGPVHGAFTGALLNVWNDGRYAGDYRSFRDAIDASIGNAAQTPQLFDALQKDPIFVEDRPFTIAAHEAASRDGVGAAFASEISNADDEDEDDPLSEAAIAALTSQKTRGVRSRSSTHSGWDDYRDFADYIHSLSLKHFDADEFLVLGGKHSTPGEACYGKNTYPPKLLWRRIADTARALDAFRSRIGKPIVITSAYRSPEYNACIDGASASLHKKFNALDFKVIGMSGHESAEALRWLRDVDGAFVGGIGRYNSFTHIDTRGYNSTWPASFKNSQPPTTSPFPARSAPVLGDRVSMVRAIKLAEGPALDLPVTSAFRATRSFNPESDVATQQQALQAAIGGSSLISFVDNLTLDQKEDVLLSTLFAQRAASLEADPIAERDLWINKYIGVLNTLGWVSEVAPFSQNKSLSVRGSFDSVVLSVIASIATQNQFMIVDSAIKELEGLAEDDGRIKLFDLESSKITGGNFQIGAAEASGDVVSLALGAFNYRFEGSKKNILFVSWGSDRLDYWLHAQKLTLSAQAYADVRDVVRKRLSTVRQTSIADIKLA